MKKVISNNIFLIEQGEAIRVEADAVEGANLVIEDTNLLINDKELTELIRRLVRREEESYIKGYDKGFGAGVRSIIGPWQSQKGQAKRRNDGLL